MACMWTQTFSARLHSQKLLLTRPMTESFLLALNPKTTRGILQAPASLNILCEVLCQSGHRGPPGIKPSLEMLVTARKKRKVLLRLCALGYQTGSLRGPAGGRQKFSTALWEPGPAGNRRKAARASPAAGQRPGLQAMRFPGPLLPGTLELLSHQSKDKSQR